MIIVVCGLGATPLRRRTTWTASTSWSTAHTRFLVWGWFAQVEADAERGRITIQFFNRVFGQFPRQQTVMRAFTSYSSCSLRVFVWLRATLRVDCGESLQFA